jgi:amino acid transporter, AAT family
MVEPLAEHPPAPHATAVTRAPEELKRSLSGRQIRMIAIGGAIGTGLFLGSAKAIHFAGPALILCYAVAGAVIFLIMRALGELVLYRPVAGAFATYAGEFLGPRAGFITGWTYWLTWIVTAMAEITAAGIYMQYWFPGLPQWVTALVMVVVLYGANLVAARLFGEFEFWFAAIKITTIVALIAVGLAVIVFSIGHLGDTAGFDNLWSHGGFFPKGIGGILTALQIVVFAFVGVEFVGVTAGEAKDPQTTLPKAINSIVVRILIFYIGALAVIMSLVPWNDLSPTESPFVTVFSQIGLASAAGIINFVVLTAALSSCNSGIFTTGRMLYTLSGVNQAPHGLHTVNSRKIPAPAITASALVMLLGVVVNYLVPARAFVLITSIATVGAMWTWGVIVVSHLAYRRKVAAGEVPASPFRMPGSPVTNWIVIAFLAFVAVLLAFNASQRIALYAGAIWAVVIGIAYAIYRRRHPGVTA